MTKKVLIKICGVKEPEIAYTAAQAGADFIGLIFSPHSRRHVITRSALAIADAARSGGAEPVAVFTESSAEQMKTLCEIANIHWVQLHGQLSRAEQPLLADTLHRIYVQTVSPNGKVMAQPTIPLDTLNSSRDYLLFDGLHAGSGEAFDWHNFSNTYAFPWFLSGGLSASNVKQAITLLHPQGVDVSSHVENQHGEKEGDLIKQFIAAVRDSEEK